MRPHSALILAALLSCLPPCPLRAATPPPADSNRILRNMDFEERRLGNAEDLPMHWLKVDGPNLPHYVNGRLSTDSHRSGEYSFRFDLNGGGLIYRYDHKQLPVQPGAHYRVDCAVKTTPLPNARARLSAYFVDADGKPLPRTTQHSELYAARSADDPWHPLSVELSADDPKAAYLVLELGLLQPVHYSPPPSASAPSTTRTSAAPPGSTTSSSPRSPRSSSPPTSPATSSAAARSRSSTS